MTNEGESTVSEEMPHARRAHYDRTKGIFVIDLTDGDQVMFPTRLYPGLIRLSDEEIEFFEIIKDGTAVRWERHDVEISIPDFVRVRARHAHEFAFDDFAFPARLPPRT